MRSSTDAGGGVVAAIHAPRFQARACTARGWTSVDAAATFHAGLDMVNGMGTRAAAATAFRTAFDHSRTAMVNWYPGHMATATRKLEDAMRHVDLVPTVYSAAWLS